jgi:hypothetical protein
MFLSFMLSPETWSLLQHPMMLKSDREKWFAFYKMICF